MITTTLNRIRAVEPCEDRWRKLLAGLGKTAPDDEPLPYARIVEINGLDDAVWATCAEPQYEKEWRLFAVWCARETLKYTNDWREVYAVQIEERYAHGTATITQLQDAKDGAIRAEWGDSWHDAKAAMFGADVVVSGTVWDASDVARTLRNRAWVVNWAVDTAQAAVLDMQTKKFLEIVR